jgi:hypothetical protein
MALISQPKPLMTLPQLHDFPGRRLFDEFNVAPVQIGGQARLEFMMGHRGS